MRFGKSLDRWIFALRDSMLKLVVDTNVCGRAFVEVSYLANSCGFNMDTSHWIFGDPFLTEANI